MTNLRTDDSPGPPTLTARLRVWFRAPVNWLAGGLARLGITPNALTVAGLVAALVAGVFAGRGQYFWSAIVLLIGLPLDAMDGAVARLTGQVSRAGALLDSTLDRYGEAAVLCGLGWHLMQTGNDLGALLAMIALFGSVMVSYLRARSEGLGVDNQVGLLTRFERTGITLLALLTGYVVVGLWILAIFSHVTVAQRLFHAFHNLRDS